MVTIQPSSRERARRRAGGWGGAVALALALLLPLAAPVLRPVGAVLGVPLYAAGRAAADAFAPLGDYLRSKRALAEENRRLAESVATLSAAAIEHDALVRERDELRVAAGLAASGSPNLLAAVVARPPVTSLGTVLIGSGEADGVAEGALALAGSVPVGVVTRVAASSAVVTLLSSPGSAIGVVVGSRVAEAEGRGDGRYEIELPAQLAPATGTAVTTEDGRPLASVAAVTAGESDATVRVLAASPVDLALVRYLVLLPASE